MWLLIQEKRFIECKKYNHLNLGIHQEGYSILLGGTVGYVVKVNDKINLDIFFRWWQCTI